MTSLPYFVFLALVTPIAAHEHHNELTEEQANAPVDVILWIHIFLQIFVWGILFPTGMVLGITRSRWHVPLQSVGFLLTAAGYILGHSHRGRAFLPSAHGSFASVLLGPIFLQLCLGVYLKLHIHERSLRPWAVRFHGLLGKAWPILGWVQMLFGAIAFRGYCRGDYLGQCLAHYIMGGGFIAYAVILAILFLVGESWIRRSGRSPEWWDSWVIMIWGIVNTFTEHHGGDWSAKDMQHTILGVLWWAGGILGIILSRNNQRSVVPSLILILTGWAMSEHAQALMISTKVHAVFGWTLMLAGVTRIIEASFIVPKFVPEAPIVDGDSHSDHTLADAGAIKEDNSASSVVAAWGRAFRHLPPFLLVCAGVLFMSGTDEELEFVHAQEMDHVTYILIMFSIAFLLYTLVISLINLYATSGRNASPASGSDIFEMAATATNWYSRVPETPVDTEPRMDTHHILGDDD